MSQIRPVARSGFGGGVLFWQKWTFCAYFGIEWTFFPEKKKKLLKNMHSETLWTYYIPFQIVTNKICTKMWTVLDSLDQNCGPFWTLWDHGGVSLLPKHPPWLQACKLWNVLVTLGPRAGGGGWVVFTSLKSALIVMLLRTHFQCLMEDVTQDTGVVIVVVVPSFFSRHF